METCWGRWRGCIKVGGVRAVPFLGSFPLSILVSLTLQKRTATYPYHTSTPQALKQLCIAPPSSSPSPPIPSPKASTLKTSPPTASPNATPSSPPPPTASSNTTTSRMKTSSNSTASAKLKASPQLSRNARLASGPTTPRMTTMMTFPRSRVGAGLARLARRGAWGV